MTVLDPTRTATAPTSAGLWGWMTRLLRNLLAPSQPDTVPTTAAGMAARATGLGGEDRHGAYVVAPGGYRIRVPSPDANGGKVGQMLPAVRQGLDLVPPLPHVVAELLREVQDANATAASVAAIAANDPSLAAGLLRTVNSSAFGLTRKVTAVSDAVSYIGFNTVKSMVLRLQLDHTLGSAAAASDPETATDVEDVWVHSLVVSYIADVLADRVVGVDRGFAATLGLLHDLGKLVVLSRFPGEAARLRVAPLVADEPLLEREARVLGVDHAALGANLAGRWGLPGDLVRAIRWHHNPGRAFEPSDPKPLHQAVAVVQVANQLAKYLYVYQDRTELDAVAERHVRLARPRPRPAGPADGRRAGGRRAGDPVRRRRHAAAADGRPAVPAADHRRRRRRPARLGRGVAPAAGRGGRRAAGRHVLRRRPPRRAARRGRPGRRPQAGQRRRPPPGRAADGGRRPPGRVAPDPRPAGQRRRPGHGRRRRRGRPHGRPRAGPPGRAVPGLRLRPPVRPRAPTPTPAWPPSTPSWPTCSTWAGASRSPPPATGRRSCSP